MVLLKNAVNNRVTKRPPKAVHRFLARALKASAKDEKTTVPTRPMRSVAPTVHILAHWSAGPSVATASATMLKIRGGEAPAAAGPVGAEAAVGTPAATGDALMAAVPPVVAVAGVSRPPGARRE